jgi:hypothetical protein
MGTWGEKTFQNDSALDWLSQLETQGASGLRVALTRAASTASDDYLDVDDGSAALAAAEIVAAAHSGKHERLTAAASSWLAAHASAISAEDVVWARRALRRLLADNSELCSLWAQQESWSNCVRELLTRVGGDEA